LTNLRREFIYDYGATHGTTALDPKERCNERRNSAYTFRPRAGKKYFGLSRNGAYDAAARGDLPTVRIGRLLRVPVRALERMLDRASETEA
jgi:hypothetical protein